MNDDERTLTPRPSLRPGGRSARVRESVHAAALSLLDHHSLGELNVSMVAAEAGVAETTIYRRWGSLPQVIAEAMSGLAVSENEIPDTGEFVTDLRQLLTNVAALIERPAVRRIFRFAISVDDDADAARTRAEFWQTRFREGTAIVTRAIDRGEIPVSKDPQSVIETLVGTAYVRSFLLDRPITDEVITSSVKAAIEVARGGE